MIMNVLLQTRDLTPLAAGPPIGGPLWSYVVPALLLFVCSLGTYLLYRHFSRGAKGEG